MARRASARPQVVTLLLALALGQLAIGQAMAAPMPGITVSPAYQELTLAEGQQSVETDISFVNTSSTERAYRLSVADFGSLDESGGVAILGQTASSLDRPFGLTSWMQLSTNDLVLPAQSKRDVTVTIKDRGDLSPGGHYGALVATLVVDPRASGDKNAIGVQQQLTSLILLAKQGGEAPGLKLVSSELNARPWALPSKVTQRYQNTGNVHVTPQGSVNLYDPAGRLVTRSVINENSGIVLPDSFRVLSSSFMPIATAWMPGRYKVVTLYGYDPDHLMKVTSYIWYAGQAIVWLVIAIICLLLGFGAWVLLRRLQRRDRAHRRK